MGENIKRRGVKGIKGKRKTEWENKRWKSGREQGSRGKKGKKAEMKEGIENKECDF